MTLDGKEIFEFRPDYAQAPELAATLFAVPTDISPAPRIGSFIGQKPIHVMSHRYVLAGDNISAFEAWFNARAGRHEAFLVPSWTAELGVAETNTTDSTVGNADLFIDWCDYANAYGPADDRLGQYVFILWSDGTVFYAEVVGVTDSVADQYDQLELSAELPKDVAVSDPPIIGFLYHARFNSDELAMEYAGNRVAQTEIGFVEVIVSTSEADVT